MSRAFLSSRHVHVWIRRDAKDKVSTRSATRLVSKKKHTYIRMYSVMFGAEKKERNFISDAKRSSLSKGCRRFHGWRNRATLEKEKRKRGRRKREKERERERLTCLIRESLVRVVNSFRDAKVRGKGPAKQGRPPRNSSGGPSFAIFFFSLRPAIMAIAIFSSFLPPPPFVAGREFSRLSFARSTAGKGCR